MNYLSRKNIFMILLICLISITFYNEASSVIIKTDETINEIKKKQFETEKKIREKERIDKELRQAEAERGEGEPVVDNTRFFINEIIIRNAELLSNGEKEELTEPYIKREIDLNDLTTLVKQITNLLIEKGYITARVKIPVNQNIKSGIVILSIVNGYIEDIVPDKGGIRNNMQVFTAFPFFRGKLLNIDDLDYGIEQMNMLRSNNATMKIFPGTDLGQSKIVIYNDTGNWLNLEAGIDNLGQKATGEIRKKYSATVDDPLSINDTVYANYTDTANSDKERKFNKSYTLYYAFPLGFWKFASTYSRSEYAQTVTGLNREFKASGKDTCGIFSIERMLFKYKFNRINGAGSMTLKKKESFIEDEKVDVSSRKLTIARAGLDYSTFLFGGYFSIGAFYSRGLDRFNAYSDRKDSDEELAEDTPRAQFEKYESEILWSRPFQISVQRFGYLCTFNGQYAMDTLYSSEKITIGDLSTVRGFKNDPVSGDRGYYIRNELSVIDFSYIWKYLAGAKFFAAYDYGYVIEKTGKDANYGEGEAKFSGYALGFSYSSRVINMNITYGRKLLTPDFVKEDRHIVYFSASTSLTGAAEESWNILKESKIFN